MTVSADSRYAGNVITPVTDAAGVTRPTILPRTPSDKVYRIIYYTWRMSDRPDTVAYRFFGNERYWWLIADVNPEIINWFSVPAGTVVRIPVA